MRRVLEGVLVGSGGRGRGQVRYDEGSGLIEAVGDLGEASPDHRFGDDCLVFAGMGDAHVHAREDPTGLDAHKEDYGSASRAAVNGGLAWCADMPNNPEPPVDEASHAAKRALARGAPVPFLIYAGVGPGTRPLPFPAPYKVYMGPSVGPLFFTGRRELREALRRYRGESVSFHCEDPDVLRESGGAATHAERRPPRAETVATRTALGLIEEFGLRGKLCHYSTGEGLALVLEARARGVDVQCEAAPQHLFFCDEMVRGMPEERRALFAMNPPIRPRADRDRMMEALLEGGIDLLATDHAPHTLDEKARGAPGLTGLDTYGAFASWLILEAGAPPELVARICSENPGRFANRFPRAFARPPAGRGFGFIEEGFSASFTVLNLGRPSVCERGRLATKAGWSPFEGTTFPGSVEAVFVGGRRLGGAPPPVTTPPAAPPGGPRPS